MVSDRLIAVIRGQPQDASIALGDSLLRSGIGSMELTMDSPGALRSVEVLASRYDGDEISVGVGTIMTPAEVRMAVSAGAMFLVTPCLDLDVIDAASAVGIPLIAGCFTPSEMAKAWAASVSAVKLFPADPPGASYMRAVRVPLSGIPMIPTGGITDANAAEFIRAGAIALGVGNWLVGSGDQQLVSVRARQLIAILDGLRN